MEPFEGKLFADVQRDVNLIFAPLGEVRFPSQEERERERERKERE